MISHRSTLLSALGVTAALFLASCGSTDSGSTTAQANSPTESTGGEAAGNAATSSDPAAPSDAADANDASSASVASDFPNVDVLDVRTGETVNLTSLAPRDKPALLWFFAPH